MTSPFKKIILLWLILFTNFLFADATKVKVLSSGPVSESGGTTDFSIQITDAVDYCDELKVDYTTLDSSAHKIEDYTKKTSFVTFYGDCDSPSRTASPHSKTVSIDIIDDSDFELDETFSLKLTSVSAGYSIKRHYNIATVTIQDDDVQPLKLISFNDKSINEGDVDVPLNMVATFNKRTVIPMTLTYHTVDASASAGNDFIGIVTKTIPILVNSNRAILPITIKGDLVPEVTKNFKVIIDSISEGTINTGENQATANIYDDDAIVFNIRSSNVLEGNLGDSNKMEFRIFLNKALPAGTADITIDYETADGTIDTSSIDTATLADSDYINTIGNVTFTEGGVTSYTVLVPIVGDTNVELDESLKMNIFRSGTNIGSSQSLILHDEGYPGVNFSREFTPRNHQVIEGNSSTRMLNFNFRLDADAVSGTSFKYSTRDNTAKSSDNDYVDTNGTYNIPAGTRDINISIPVNGDLNIEQDERFYLLISDEQHLNVVGHLAKGYIINDDGKYPEIDFDLATYDIDEGNSGVSDINFTLFLNKPAVAGASFNYHTEDVNTTNSDYVTVPATPYTFIGGETNITIPIQVKGDVLVEEDETFKLILSDFDKFDNLPTDTLSAYAVINNDDLPHDIENIGEFRFDDCGAEEWRIDQSSTANNALGSPNSLVTNDGKSYMCGSIGTYRSSINIPHHLAYEVDEGTFSMLLYDHHNVGGWLFQKGNFKIQIVRVDNNRQGSIKVDLNGQIINTGEIFFTNSGTSTNNLDTQWIQVTVTFGSQGLKLYINGVEKGSKPYTGGIKSNNNPITLSTASGYFDEFYMFKGQMNDGEVQQAYDNLINDINIDGTPRDCGCYVASDPFTCDSTMYISSSTNRETSATGRMWLHRVDTATNPFDFKLVEPVGHADLYNATAFSPDNHYIYGLFHRELVQISRGGTVTSLGQITGLPNRFDSAQLYAGAISNSYYYVAGRNSPKNKIYKIDINSTSPNYKSVTTIRLSKAVALQDFSFYKNVSIPAIPEGAFLYGVDRDNKLSKVDVRDGTVTQIGSKHIGYEFDSSFSDKNGRFFANDSLGNGFFEFDLTTGVKSFISNSQSATFNDGANCIDASLVFSDYGDAPSTYGTARHNIANGIFMGDEVDHDVHAYFGIDATGDDSNGVDDEDGITLVDGSDINGSFFEPGTTQDFKIKVSKDGYLNTWVDYNLDGDFEDAGEKIFSAKFLTQGEHALSFNVPMGLTVRQTSYIRFRFSSTATLSATQNASDGEVEDYAIKFGTDVFRGVFNIERTNSGSFRPLNSDARNAWYTQIVGRDFDYSIIFYEEDMSAEKIIFNLTCKVELVDMENNTTLYERYFHFPANSTSSRFDIRSTNPRKNAESDDLSEQSASSFPSIPASRDVRFRISYEDDGAGNIIQKDCTRGITEADYKLCYNDLDPLTLHFQPANDNFAIRPESYYIKIADHAVEKRDSKNSINTPLTLASGYDYNLTVVATKIGSIEPAKGYDYQIRRKLDFTGSPVCDNTTSPTQEITFNNGLYNNINFTHDNVGNYAVKLVDDHNWTHVDQIKGDCLSPNDFTVSANGNTLSGCDITPPNFDLNLSFYPYQFGLDDVNFTVLPIDDNEFLYMDRDLDTVAVQLIGTVIAQNQSGDKTSNFTENCMATNVDLTLGVDYTSDTGFNTALQTTLSRTGGAKLPVRLNRSFEFNKDGATMFERNITTIVTPITIGSGNFLETNRSKRGSVFVDMRYNIAKNVTRTINPIQIAFNTLDADSSPSQSHAEEINNFIPRGHKDLNQTRFFYFTQVVPDKPIYPRVNFPAGSPAIAVGTPLSVDIFCKNNLVPNFCDDMNIFNNTLIHASPRKADGWYISTNHNHDFDGNITQLTSLNPISLTVAPNNNIPFTNGQNAVISTVNNSINSNNVVTITVPSQLEYMDQNYTVPVTGNASSDWAGIGRAGNVINIKANTKNSNKNDW